MTATASPIASVNTPCVDLRQLETELDAFLADYQRMPLLGASEGLHARKRRFLERVTALAQQSANLLRMPPHPMADATTGGRGRPARSSNADVIRAGLQLESEGKRVTGSKLRSLLGGGRVDRYASIWAEYLSHRQQDAAPQGTHPVAELIARQHLVDPDSTLPVVTKPHTAPPVLPN